MELITILENSDTRKQVNQGWGAQTGDKAGDKAWDDERAAENLAQNESEPQTPANEEPAEPAEKTKTYAEYLAEKAAQGDLAAKPIRAPNEGSNLDKKWANAKELKRTPEEEEAYIKGKEEKAKREKQRKEKNVLEVDMRFVESPRGGSAGRGRGGRGGRGGRSGRGNGAPRGEQQQRGAPPVTVDEKNFPSLGAK